MTSSWFLYSSLFSEIMSECECLKGHATRRYDLQKLQSKKWLVSALSRFKTKPSQQNFHNLRYERTFSLYATINGTKIALYFTRTWACFLFSIPSSEGLITNVHSICGPTNYTYSSTCHPFSPFHFFRGIPICQAPLKPLPLKRIFPCMHGNPYSIRFRIARCAGCSSIDFPSFLLSDMSA